MKRVVIVLLSLLMLCSIAHAEKLDYESDFSSSTDGWYGRGASSAEGGAVRVTTGKIDGDVLCEFTLPAGHEGEMTVDTAHVEGVTDLYIIFAGNVTADWWTITPEN